MRYLYLYLFSFGLYLVLMLINFLRGLVKKSNYDYWITGYLFDKKRAFLFRLLILLLYTTGIFLILWFYVTYQGLEIPYLT